MPKLFKIPMMLYIEAHNEKQAEVGAEFAAFKATAVIRKNDMLEDTVSIVIRNGRAQPADKAPKESYDKKFLIEAIGEDRAVAWLNHIINSLYP